MSDDWGDEIGDDEFCAIADEAEADPSVIVSDKSLNLLDDGEEDMFNDRDDVNQSPSLLDDDNDDMFNDRDDVNQSPSLLDDDNDVNQSPSLLDDVNDDMFNEVDKVDQSLLDDGEDDMFNDKDDVIHDVDNVDQSLLDDGEDDLFNELDDSGNNEAGDTKVNSDDNKDIEVKEKADSDDFASLNLEPPTSNENAFLSANFGHSSFKPLQWRIVSSVMKERRDQCCVMPTGYGKSLCFQFQPVYQDKVCIVISPLISLMEDQVLGLKSSGISADFLGSAQNNSSKVIKDFSQGKISLLYVTPEFITMNPETILNNVPDLNAITAIAVDEAHCVSQWGHDFRTSYRELSTLKKTFPGVPIIALTATATPHIQADICKSLNLTNPQLTRTSFNRPNLYLEVRPKLSVWRDLSMMLEPSKNPEDQKRFPGPTIIYCPTKKEVEHVYEELTSHGVSCVMYHAGRSQNQRKEAHRFFLYDEVQVVVATIAFGMGIDKPDVRCVIHYGAPKDMESYYQEIGRAGRDGLNSTCRIYWASKDFNTHRHFLLDTKSAEWRQHRSEMIHQMELFLNNPDKCRRLSLLSHFEPAQTGDSLGVFRSKYCCDTCTSHILKGGAEGGCSDSTEANKDFGEDARLFLSALQLIGDKRGFGTIVKVVRGTKDKNIYDRWIEHESFGKGKLKSVKYWTALGRTLISKGYIKEVKETFGAMKGRMNSYLATAISVKGAQFIRSKEQLIIPVTGDLAEKKNVPKPVVITPRFGPDSGPKDTQRFKLYELLISLRTKIAAENDIPPYMVITGQTVMQLAETLPSTMESLKRVQGFNDAKIEKYGRNFLNAISEFAGKNPGTKLDNFVDTTAVAAGDDSEDQDSIIFSLPSSIKETYMLYKEKKSLEQIAIAKGVKPSTVASYLATAIEKGVEVDISYLGVTPAIVATVARVVHAQPINSDISRLSPVKHELDLIDMSSITYDLIKLILARLKVEHGVNAEGVLQWTDQQFQSYLTDNKVASSNIQQSTASSNIQQSTASSNVQERVAGINNVSNSHLRRGLNSMTSEKSQTGISKPVLTNSTNMSGPGFVERTQPGSSIVPPDPDQPGPGKKRKLPDWMMDSKQRSQVMKSRMKNNSLFK